MTRISFFGTEHFSERDLSALLYEKIENLMGTDDQFEFWFQRCYRRFETLAMQTIEQLIKDHPEKDIQIVHVIDKIQYATTGNDPYDLDYAGIPKYLPTRNEFVPESLERPISLKGYFIQARKVDHWIYSQCDYLFTYAYLNLPSSENTDIKAAMKKPHLIVDLLFFEKTSKLIDEHIERLEGREKVIVKALNEGMTAGSIGKSMNITGTRVNQLARRATIRIVKQLRCERYVY